MSQTLPNQRWRNGRDSYRPAEPIQTQHYEVAAIADDATAKRFVLKHHYSGSYPAAVFRFGLYSHNDLAGVAVFSVPMCREPIGRLLPVARDAVPELGRFVLLDQVPGNGESWFLSRCFNQLRKEGVAAVFSCSDPEQRTSIDGSTVFGGHVGCIYQAFNGTYVGRTRGRWQHLLPDGSIFSERMECKIRAAARHGPDDPRARGWLAGVRKLRSYGAGAPSGDLLRWLEDWKSRLCRRRWHDGNHKYVWAVDRRLRRHLPTPRPFPKLRHRLESLFG